MNAIYQEPNPQEKLFAKALDVKYLRTVDGKTEVIKKKDLQYRVANKAQELIDNGLLRPNWIDLLAQHQRIWTDKLYNPKTKYKRKQLNVIAGRIGVNYAKNIDMGTLQANIERKLGINPLAPPLANPHGESDIYFHQSLIKNIYKLNIN
jgi:hypothetical protein